MKQIHLIGLAACLALIGCESTESSANGGNQEAKRRTAAQQQQEQQSTLDESQQNLYNAQRNTINRTTPVTRY